MATVFAFELAASNMLGPNNPVTCIGFASPMVGNLTFKKAYETLQSQGRIRSLRVTNYFDIFTQLPDRASYLYAIPFWWGPHMIYYYIAYTFLFFVCCQNRVYRHVGMALQLYSQEGRYKFKYRKSRRNYCLRLILDWKQHWKQTVQRIMTIPFVCFCDCCCMKENFNKNHSVVEHMHRLKGCSMVLQDTYLNDLYKEESLEMVGVAEPTLT